MPTGPFYYTESLAGGSRRMRQALARHRADDRPDRDSRSAACAANVLLFDFRGHGESDGHTVRFGAGERRDVLAAVAYLRERRPGQARQVVGLGVSMGAATLTLAAAEVRSRRSTR